METRSADRYAAARGYRKNRLDSGIFVGLADYPFGLVNYYQTSIVRRNQYGINHDIESRYLETALTPLLCPAPRRAWCATHIATNPDWPKYSTSR